MPARLIEDPSTELWESLKRLDKDLRSAANLLAPREARYLVDTYYSIQDYRFQAAGQIRAIETAEPSRILEWTFTSMRIFESDIQKALGEFSHRYKIGRWLMSICGIGPVISAGLLTHLDVRGKKTAGHFWKFAGLDPSAKWEKKQKRPWNAKLKVLLWKAGQSFIKVSTNKKDFYGKMYVARKIAEWEKNLEGKNAPAAAENLAGKNYGRDTNARAWYEGRVCPKWARMVFEAGDGFPATLPKESKGEGFPMLPPAHIHARARRWIEKVFLSHVHHAMYEDFYGESPIRPYVFDMVPGDHRHFIALPNWPFCEGGESLKVLLTEEQEE